MVVLFCIGMILKSVRHWDDMYRDDKELRMSKDELSILMISFTFVSLRFFRHIRSRFFWRNDVCTKSAKLVPVKIYGSINKGDVHISIERLVSRLSLIYSSLVQRLFQKGDKVFDLSIQSIIVGNLVKFTFYRHKLGTWVFGYDTNIPMKEYDDFELISFSLEISGSKSISSKIIYINTKWQSH